MMTEVFIASDNIFSPIGSTTAENFTQLKKNISGVKLHDEETMAEQPFYASLFSNDYYSENKKYTKFEQLLIDSIGEALENSGIDAGSEKTILIISSTKGNISLLETEENNAATKMRVSLHHSAKLIAAYFHFLHQPVVISNACISGILAMILGMRLIQSGQYENAVIAGADVISKFVLSGFQSFQAISPGPCKPFDKTRNGINLGEGAGTIVLSSNKKYYGNIKISGGSTSNDANHISGPSRTGEELYLVIKKAMKDANVLRGNIDFISAHGTATIYNDEMEAKAITLAGMQSVPVNSLKGYYGHTLGAAGIIESIVSAQSLKENIILPTRGFKESGVTTSLNILNNLQNASLKNCLKTASGFGGCNAAVILSKQ
jgi:3-oxoacyl-[acyl-carrier-protein] synthase-1